MRPTIAVAMIVGAFLLACGSGDLAEAPDEHEAEQPSPDPTGRKGKKKRNPGEPPPAPSVVNKSCTVSAWLADKGDAAVRPKPRDDLDPVGTLPGDTYYLRIEIDGVKGDHVHIDGASIEIPADDGDATLPSSAKKGWIRRDRVGFQIESAGTSGEAIDARLFAEPTLASKQLVVFHDGALAVDEFLGCAGEWAKVRVEGKEGWVHPEHQCHHAQTNCINFADELEKFIDP